MMKKTSALFFLIVSIHVIEPGGILCAQEMASGKDTISKNGKSTTLSLRAVRLQDGHNITLDGKLDEDIWKQAPAATGFTQREPHDGTPATEQTEVHIIYTNKALYIGAKAYDSAMDSVAATLFRRDGDAYSDWLYVNIDSYNDNRTSFSFAVNPRGVRKDILTYNDNNEDDRWDAVWKAKTQIQHDSWTVEMRIPLSQLRFNSKKDKQDWGVNFERKIARKGETSYWSPTPQSASGLVSCYGDLEGINHLSEPNRLEITPYTSSSISRAPGTSENPFYDRNDLTASAGADFKYGLTSDFTLTGTINPDFGQVESDPAVINLSAFETYFSEQRPFFLEGTDIFQFGGTETFNTFGNPLIFYSRRIGRHPQGELSSAGIDASFADSPDQTTIASAIKVSGKTQNGLSIGVLNAFTTQEKATYVSPENQKRKISIEPPANYFVGRLKKDFGNGKTIVGGYLSSVNRFINTDYLKSDLHSSSYIGGLDFEHSWNDRDWIISGVLSASQVNGTNEVIGKTQAESDRYYNRVDADYLSLDPDKTSLSGFAAELSFARYGGTHWRGSLTYSGVSPGYEVNDIGFENRADYNALSYLIQYRETSPSSPFRFFNFNMYSNPAWNFGGEIINNSFGMNTNMDFTNLWSLHLNAGYNGKTYDDRMLRGGPLATDPISYYYSGVIETNQSKLISFDAGHFRWQSEADEMERDFFIDMTIRPTSYIQLTISPNYNYQTSKTQYVRSVGDETATNTYGTRYVFADINRKMFSTAFRLDWTFSTDMSLQTYVRPLLTSGDFYNYKEFNKPRTHAFDVYGKDKGTISKSEETYTVDPDGPGGAGSFTFDEQDFNFRSIQTNAVFRWEYAPGSVLYVVWQQDRSGSVPMDNLRLRRDFDGLFKMKPTNIFLAKLSYWFGS